MTRADRLLVVALAVLALIAWPLVAAAAGSGQRVTISGPAGESVVALSEPGTLLVEGRAGTVCVVIEGETVRVTEADCPDQVCVKTGAISSAGAVIACVPNGVVVQVEGGGDGGLDARIR